MKLKLGKKHCEEILIFFIFIVAIYLSGTILVAIVNENDLSKKLSILLLLMMAYFVISFIPGKKRRNELMIVAVVAAGFFVINYINYSATFESLLMRVLWFVMAFAMYRYTGLRQINIEKFFYLAVMVIVWVTFIFFVLVEILKLELPYSNIGSRSLVYHNYSNLYYNADYYLRSYLGVQFHRLHGVFWEPGVYQVFLNYALFYQLIKSAKKNWISVAVLLISIILTVSTTGLIIAVALVALAMYRGKKIRRFKAVFVIPIFALAVAVCYNIWMEKVITGEGSYLARMSDLTIGLQLFLQNFVIGTGYDNVQIFTLIQNRGRGSSNGFVTWCYTMGSVGLVACIYPFIKNIIIEKDREKKINKIVNFGIFLVCNMSEPVYFAPFMWMLVAKEYAVLKSGGSLVPEWRKTGAGDVFLK